MSKVTRIVDVVLFDQSFANDFKVIRIYGPMSPRPDDIRAYNAERISHYIRQNTESGSFVPEAIYQVDVNKASLDLSKLARNRPPRTLEGHLTKEFFHPDTMQDSRIYFAAYAKGSPAQPTAVKRKRSAEANVDAAKKARTPLTVQPAATRPSLNRHPVNVNKPGDAHVPISIVGDDKGHFDALTVEAAATRPAVNLSPVKSNIPRVADDKGHLDPPTVEAAATRLAVKLRPVKINIPGYADAPIYIVGDDTGRLDLSAPPSDFERCLFPPRGQRHLFSDPTANLSQFFGSAGDKILGVYTPAPADLDAALSASMVTAYTDRSKESQYPETFGKLAAGPAGCSSYPPSKDFVLEFDFASLAVESLTLTTFKSRLNGSIHSCVAGFILKYDKYLHFGPAGEFLKTAGRDGPAALKRILTHIETSSDNIEDSHVFIIVRNYDCLWNLAEAKSITTSESSTPPSDKFPPPSIITDLFKQHLYDIIFHNTGTISKVCLFGTSPAFAGELHPSDCTDRLARGALGLAGVTAGQVAAYLSVAVGDQPPLGMDLLVCTVCDILPGYVYAANTPPQYPRRLLHKFLTQLQRLPLQSDEKKIRRLCMSLVADIVTPHMLMAAKTWYNVGRQFWQPQIDMLRVEKTAPSSPFANVFRHRYDAFKVGHTPLTDVSASPLPDSFFAFCVDAGYLTMSFGVPGAGPGDNVQYTFPGDSVYSLFCRDILGATEQSTLTVQKAFDGTAKWIFDTMDPYLVTTRSTMSNVNARENTFRNIRANLMRMADAHGGGNLALEAKLTGWYHTATLIPLYAQSKTIIIMDISINVFDLIQGTIGTIFPRHPSNAINENQFEAEHWQAAIAFTNFLRGLPASVFTDARLPDNFPQEVKHPLRDLEVNPPTRLEDFFFTGTVRNRYGRHSIFELWESAENEGLETHMKDLRLKHVSDAGFTCEQCPNNTKNSVTVIVVMVLGGVRVLARPSSLTRGVELKHKIVRKRK